MTMTIEKLLETKRLLNAAPPMPYPMRVFVTENAMEATDIRLFKKSRYRSARVFKKLIKRFSGEFKKVPCIWRTPQGLVMHPERYAAFKAELSKQPHDGRAHWNGKE